MGGPPVTQLIVGLSGKKGAGKDTVAKAMAEHLRRASSCGALKVPGGWSQTAASGFFPIMGAAKRHCVDFYGLPERAVYGDDAAKGLVTDYRWENLPHYREIEEDHYALLAEGLDSELPTGFMTVREFLQQYGTEIARRMNLDVHVQATLRQIEKANVLVAFVPDVRFPNEVEAIRAKGGKVIRLTRAPHPDSHVSETALDPIRFNWSNFDAVLDNDRMTLGETIRGPRG